MRDGLFKGRFPLVVIQRKISIGCYSKEDFHWLLFKGRFPLVVIQSEIVYRLLYIQER